MVLSLRGATGWPARNPVYLAKARPEMLEVIKEQLRTEMMEGMENAFRR